MERTMEKLDYSLHQLEVKRMMMDIHKLILVGQFTEAVKLVDPAIVELRLMKAAINSHVRHED
jgi:hypothetical protein